MSIYYLEETFVYPPATDKHQREVFHGNGWKALANGAEYLVEHISGELAGRTNKLAITEQEYQQLSKGDITFDSLLIKYEKN